MATRTTNLNLQLPGKGEFRDSWNIPLNSNFELIDVWAGDIQLEISEARFNAGSLKDFLAVSHDADGQLYPTKEVFDARNSFLYGNKSGTDYFLLKNLSYLRDKEMWGARRGQSSLKNGMAFPGSFGLKKILTGFKDANSYPAWCGHTANKVQIDGRPTPIWMEIDGQVSRIRTLKEVTVSGAAGTYYIYAQYSDIGVVNYSDTGASCGQESSTGDVRIHEHSSVQYTLLDVVAGDVLNYSLPTTVTGDYLIEEVAPDGEISRLKITGIFPQEASTITYTIRDPLAVTLGFDAVETAAAGKIYLAEADFDGTSVTAVRTRNFGDKFVSEWRAVDVSLIPTFEEIWNHTLGSTELQVTIQASQSNDGTMPVEELTVTKLSASLSGLTGGSLAGSITAAITGAPTLAVGGSLVASVLGAPGLGTIANTGGTPVIVGAPDKGTLSVSINEGGKTYTPDKGTLGATITDGKSFVPSNGTLGVDAVPNNSVIMKYDSNRIWIKNAVSAFFYKDYDGTSQQTGFIRVIISKRG